MKVERQCVNITRAIAMLDSDTPDAAAPLVTELAALAKRKQQLEAEREKVQQRCDVWAQAQARLDSLQSWCANVAARLRSFSYEEKRMAIEALGVRALVYRQDHVPRFIIEANIPLGPDIASTTSM
ncbi:MAG TPA: hypothetical protein VLA19_32325 [Herpetosiphonaceae bacterium]|nr:hypothetical protein [Herpetosiphonaceae bacterium]